MTPRRRDYRSNIRKPFSKRSGCTWCGADVDRVTDYCSDTCLQTDMDGIDDLPPVVPLAYTDPAYVARKWSPR